MKYNFDKPINRQGTHCVKWDMAPHYPQTPTPNPSRGEGSLDTLSHQGIATEANQAPLPWGGAGGGLIPLWVADMDFEAAPAIRAALQKRVEHGVFGYAIVQDSYYDAVINWYERRHQWHIEREWIQYTTGVVPAISAVIKALTMPGERVLIMTPVYNCFFSSIRNNGCEVLESKLVPVEARRPTPSPLPVKEGSNYSQGGNPQAEMHSTPLPHREGQGGGSAGGGPLAITFHRAFDRCANPAAALEELIQQGFDRVLTSGQQPTAEQGIPLLRQLQEQALGRIIIMAGCGVNEQNIRRIQEETGVSEFHFSAREPLRSQMQFSNPDVYMGAKGADEDTILRTTARRVSETIKQLRGERE